MSYTFIKVCFSILSYRYLKKIYHAKNFLNDKNYQLQPPLQKTAGDLQTSTAPSVWTMAVFEWCGITCTPEMVWSWTLLPLETNQFPLDSCVPTDTTTCRESLRNQPWSSSGPTAFGRDNNPTMPLQNCKTAKLMMLKPCFYSGYIYEFFSATCRCSCSNHCYRNVKFLHTIHTDWGIPLFSNKHGFGLAKDFTKMKFYQLLNCSLLLLLPWNRTTQ